MRYVILGAGAVGGTIAARLAMTGQDVVGVARGAHLEALASRGLLFRTPDGDTRVDLAVTSLDDLRVGEDDVLVLAVKSQDTTGLLVRLAGLAATSTPVVCAQNGVANEPGALRWFERVYGMVVMCPCLHLEPGVVAAYSTPTVGILDLGRYPAGEDEVSRMVAVDLETAGFSSHSVPDIARWKHAKLITNLGNAVEAVCGPSVRGGRLTEELHREARDVLDRHGIEYASPDEDRARRGDILRLGEIDGPRPGGSAWQSVTRGLAATEVDHLCGEVVRLARLQGRTAPANQVLQEMTREVALGRRPVAGTAEDQVLAAIEAGGGCLR